MYISECAAVLLLPHTGSELKAAGEQPITIETGCLIGSNVTILPGVCVRKGTIVAAGAVVTKDCEPNCIYAGVPAIKKRILSINEISL